MTDYEQARESFSWGQAREQLDIDSMDMLNLVVAVHGRTGVEIPERDYPKLATLDGAVAYLAGAGEPR